MNYFNWKFSKQAQPELNKFLKAVQKYGNNDKKVENTIKQIIAQLKHQNNSENSEEITIIEDDVIIIDDNDENTEDLTNIPLLNQTESVNKQQNNETNEDINKFLSYLQECLETDDYALENEYIVKLKNDFNSSSLTYLFTNLIDLSEKSLHNLNQSICSNKHLEVIPDYYCKIILLSKVQQCEPAQKLKMIIKDFGETFPKALRTDLLIHLLLHNLDNSKWCQIIINQLAEIEKDLLLKDFLHLCTELELWQLSVLPSLLSSTTEEVVKRRLINLMEMSADKFKTEKLFLKLLISVINNLESGFDDQENILFSIIEKNNSVFKGLAKKALNDWIKKYNNY